jgi:hypothetical protein
LPKYGRRAVTTARDRKRITGSAQMLLRYDLRPDREGWTVFDVTTDHPAFCVRGWRLFYRRCDPIKNSLKCSRSP